MVSRIVGPKPWSCIRVAFSHHVYFVAATKLQNVHTIWTVNDSNDCLNWSLYLEEHVRDRRIIGQVDLRWGSL